VSEQIKVDCQKDSLKYGKPDPGLGHESSQVERVSRQELSEQNTSDVVRRNRPKEVYAPDIEGAKDNRDDSRAEDGE
jgi:hypothetical protein